MDFYKAFEPYAREQDRAQAQKYAQQLSFLLMLRGGVQRIIGRKQRRDDAAQAHEGKHLSEHRSALTHDV